jgi:putative transposase
MNTVISFRFFACARSWTFQKMAIIIGATCGKSKRKQDDEYLAERIEDAYQKHGGKYGSPRIHAELKAQGIHCGKKRVARLMREHNLSAGKKRRKARTTNSHHQFPIASNLLKRDFEAFAPNKKWVADITFIETREGWLYLSGVLDTYSRKIVGWAMDKYHDANLVKTALHLALLNRRKGGWSDSSFGSWQ